MAYNGCTGHRSFAEYSTPGEPCYIDAIQVITGFVPFFCRVKFPPIVFFFGQLGLRNAIAAERMIASLLR